MDGGVREGREYSAAFRAYYLETPEEGTCRQRPRNLKLQMTYHLPCQTKEMVCRPFTLSLAVPQGCAPPPFPAVADG
jgi:hypothetical protein